MNFTVEFYETTTGSCPVRDFLDDLKAGAVIGRLLAEADATAP